MLLHKSEITNQHYESNPSLLGTFFHEAEAILLLFLNTRVFHHSVLFVANKQ